MGHFCCGRQFNGFNSIRNHLDNAAVHAGQIECHWCFKRWPSHAGTARLKHEQEDHWLKCSADNDCRYVFKNQADLDDHINQAHPPHYCYSCQRPFTSASNLNQHLRSSIHVGKTVKCPWCTIKFTNLTGVCLHLESSSCASNINREKINDYCRQVDRDHVFTEKQIGWYDSKTTNIATEASWDGSCYACVLCDKGFSRLQSLNQHLASPVHQQKLYHCPRCKHKFIALSGLVNHLESESCGAFRFQAGSRGLAFVDQLRIEHTY